jgi:hypothetical protein
MRGGECAGGRRWPAAWAYLETYATVFLRGIIFAVRGETRFTEERTRVKRRAKAWDRVLAGSGLSVFPRPMRGVAALLGPGALRNARATRGSLVLVPCRPAYP